jgi:hypothetical protein
MLYSVLSVARKPSPFVERFKYDVISSSLLSSELATPLLHLRHQTSYNVPGRLSSGHSRGPSTEGSVFLEKTSFVDQRLIHTPFAAELRYWFTTLAFVAIAAVWSIGYYIPAFLAFGGTLYCLQYGNLEIAPKLAMTSVSSQNVTCT